MAKTKVTVRVYHKLNDEYFQEQDHIISQERYEELVQARAKELKANDIEFAEYLSDNYECIDIWEMTEEDRAKVRKDYESKCEDWARDDLEDEWECYVIETSVETPTSPTPKKVKVKCECVCHQ
jgi:uncharacterized protein (UPF0305 family)